MSISLRFCGAARTVTGSCFWLRTPQANFLIDCGLFQGSKTLKQLNYGAFPFASDSIDFVLQTHAHIDHAGLLPKLCKRGFKGPTYMTRGTRDLLTFMLPDSGHIQETDVANLNRRNARRKRQLVDPIYSQKEAEACLQSFRTVEYGVWLEPAPGVRARYWNAGHILGSASIELEIATGQPEQPLLRLLFSGDIGPDHKLFQPDPTAPETLDYVICEATYGARQRPKVTPEERCARLAGEVRQALANNGMLLIPLFAVERTQELLVDLAHLQQTGAIPPVPMFLDSPLAIRITRVFQQHSPELQDLDIRPSLMTNPNLHLCETVDQSKAIDRLSRGAIILSASGMCDAGRIRHHLKRWLWSEKATVLLVGYQAHGTLGRLLADGATTVTIQGEVIKVTAKVRQLDVYSGHADRGELLNWIKRRHPIRRALFLVHGDDPEIKSLREGTIADGMSEAAVVTPTLDDEFDLVSNARIISAKPTPPRIDTALIGQSDWHNELAQFTFDLRDRLEQAADERSRRIVMRRLRRALDDNDRL